MNKAFAHPFPQLSLKEALSEARYPCTNVPICPSNNMRWYLDTTIVHGNLENTIQVQKERGKEKDFF